MSLCSLWNGRWRSRARALLPLRILGAMLSLLAAQTAFAQQFTFRHYIQQDGLSNLSVSSLLQDRAGYIWVGTENGLFRHDSTEFIRFGDAEGLKDTSIHSTVEDSSGRLWVGTSHDLYVRDGTRFIAVRPDGNELTVDSGARIAAPAPDRLLVIDKESLVELWLSADKSIWHSRHFFSAEQIQSVPALSHLSSLYVDSHGRIWLGCGDQICSVESGRVNVWNAGSGVPKDVWHAWLRDKDNRLWVRGLEHVLVLAPGASAFANRDARHGRLTAGILNVPLMLDQQGRVVTRSDMGLMRWRQDHWEEFNADNGITTPEISAMLTSRDGNVWLGMSGHGLWRWLGYGTFESWTVGRGLSSNPVWEVLRGADHAIIIGTRSGCLRIDEISHAAIPCGFEGLPPGEIQVIAKRGDHSLWFGTATGQLLRIAAGQRRAVAISTIPMMRKLLVDSTDRLWICSSKGIHLVPAGSNRVEPVALPDGLGEITDAAQDDSGTLWFATQGGLLRRTNEQWSLLNLDDPAHTGFGSVTPARNGWLWAGGASHGLIHVHVRGSQVDHAEWITDPGMANAAIYFTQQDSRGWLWAGTDNGFAVFDGTTWRRFNQADGLIWNDTDENAVFADDDGSMWIGTSGGLTHILHPELLIQSGPLDLRITSATLGTAQLGPGAARRLKWSHGPALDVHLADLDFGDPSQTMLRARLRGLSDDWFQTHDFNMHYPGLAPGSYTFEAMAVDSDHQRVSAVVTLGFEILPPWWQSAWFRVLTGMLVAAILVGAWRWSMLHLDARRRALERELQEREALLERATRDALTRLWNRQAIMEILQREIDTARRCGTPLAVALIDIDHFKHINDTMGHLAGDEVLRVLGSQLSGRLRARDALGRYGGEELLLIVPEASPQRPFLPMERLQRLITEIPFSYNGTPIRVTASFGVAWLSVTTDNVQDLIRRADQALYDAKYAGRDRVAYAATGS